MENERRYRHKGPKYAILLALLASTVVGGTITLGKPGRGSWTRRTDMAAEIHIWQPVNGGDTLADASWDTLAPAGQASEFGTFSGLPVNNETVEINASGHVTPGSDKTYTFKTTLTPAANEVKIGSDAAECARNLVSAIMADGNTDRYGAGTVAHDAVTAVLSGSDVQLTSVHYGTDPNDIVLADSATNFVWDGGAVTLSGGVTTWTTGDAEIILDGNNHSDLTDNLDWITLLAPEIKLSKITKQPDNFSAIGSPGVPWAVEGSTTGSRFFNAQGSGQIYFKSGEFFSWTFIQDGPEFAVITGTLQGLHVKRGHCECPAAFVVSDIVAVTTTGSHASIDLQGTSDPPGQINAAAGNIKTARDLDGGKSIIVGDGHVLFVGRFSGAGGGSGLVTVNGGTFSAAPRIETSNPTMFILMGGHTSFADSQFDITAVPLIIGPRASFDRGPVVTGISVEVDLRKRHP